MGPHVIEQISNLVRCPELEREMLEVVPLCLGRIVRLVVEQNTGGRPSAMGTLDVPVDAGGRAPNIP